jgi:hypothetical protein
MSSNMPTGTKAFLDRLENSFVCQFWSISLVLDLDPDPHPHCQYRSGSRRAKSSFMWLEGCLWSVPVSNKLLYKCTGALYTALDKIMTNFLTYGTVSILENSSGISWLFKILNRPHFHLVMERTVNIIAFWSCLCRKSNRERLFRRPALYKRDMLALPCFLRCLLIFLAHFLQW